MDLLLLTTTLPGGSGQWDSCTYTAALPWGLGVAGSGSTAAWRFTVSELRVVDLLLHTASLPGGSGQWDSCTYCRTALWQQMVDPLLLAASLPLGSGQWISYGTLPHCLGEVKSGQWSSSNAPLHCLGAMGIGTDARHRCTARG